MQKAGKPVDFVKGTPIHALLTDRRLLAGVLEVLQQNQLLAVGQIRLVPVDQVFNGLLSLGRGKQQERGNELRARESPKVLAFSPPPFTSLTTRPPPNELTRMRWALAVTLFLALIRILPFQRMVPVAGGKIKEQG
jgi:hypothetical protein